MRARLTVVLATSALAFYAWACSGSDPEEAVPTDDGGTVDQDGGDTTTEDGGGTGTDSGNPTKQDSGPTVVDAGSDGGDAGDGGGVPPSLCLGNPFLPDGGATTPDGGYALDGGGAALLTAVNGFLDGPQWIDENGGRLVFSDFFEASSYTIPDAGGNATLLRRFSTPPGNATAPLVPIGNAYHGGVIYSAVVNGAGGAAPEIGRTWALDGGALPSLPVGATVGSPNDLVINNGQVIYFTDPRYQSANNGVRGVYQMLIDGGAFSAADGGIYQDNAPNGIALSPDRTKLYVSFTGNGGGNDFRVDVFSVTADGKLGNPQPFLNNTRLGSAPDGLAVDVVGNLYVAEAAADNSVVNGRVEVFSPTGLKWGALVFPNRRITGVAFGGADNTSLFITAQNGVFVFKNRCAGVR